jgi:hypothetical protein
VNPAISDGRHEHVGAASRTFPDLQFITDCQARGLPIEQIPDLFCLHLAHPFAWYGTTAFL